MIVQEKAIITGTAIGILAAHILQQFGAPLKLADVGRVLKCEDRTAKKRLVELGLPVKALYWPGELARALYAEEEATKQKFTAPANGKKNDFLEKVGE